MGADRAHRLRRAGHLRLDPGRLGIYALGGLVIFAGLVLLDFQRLRASSELDRAPLLAASIFLDILNLFQFFLTLFGRTRR